MRKKIENGVGKRLQSIRGGLSQVAFASRHGVHKNTLGHYERGERAPDGAFLSELARTGVNVNWLLTGAGSMHLNGNAATPECVDVALIRYIEGRVHAVIEAEGPDLSVHQTAKLVSGLYNLITRESITGEARRAKVVRLAVNNST